MFAEGQQHRDAAEAANDLTREIRESFGHLPFHSASELDTEEPSSDGRRDSSSKEPRTPQGPSVRTPSDPEPLKGNAVLTIKENFTESCKDLDITQSKYYSFFKLLIYLSENNQT